MIDRRIDDLSRQARCVEQGHADALVPLHDEVAQHRIVETEPGFQLGDALRIALDVHEDVVGLEHLVDRVGQLAPTPVLETVDHPTPLFQIAAIALDHRRHLLALAWVHQKDHFVMTHGNPLWLEQPPAWRRPRR